MKRSWWIALAVAGVALVVAGGLALAENDDQWFHRGYGPGMMWEGGMGPGMMGGGYGPGTMGGGTMGMGPAFRQLPAEKQEQLRKVQVSTLQAMVALMTDMQAKAETLQEAMGKFPIDQPAAKKAHDAVKLVQDQMFALRLSQLAQVQQIVGKDTWDTLQNQSWGWGPGRGGPGGMMGPGGRGPAR
jgi:hypothetical protein